MKKMKSSFELITDDPVKVKLLQTKSDLMDDVVEMIRYKIDTLEWTQSLAQYRCYRTQLRNISVAA